MSKSKFIKSMLMGSVLSLSIAASVVAREFDIPAGDLGSALDIYAAQSGVTLIVSDALVKGLNTRGVAGSLSADAALSRLLSGTGLSVHHENGGMTIVRSAQSSQQEIPIHIALAASGPAPALETVTVTSSKLGGGDVQSIPIAITALSQEQLTATQTAGGPDLVKQVPNLTFSKTNFTGYNIQIRGIGTQAISVTTDPAVAVAMNDIPFIRNHFFEQEFYDLGSAEVLRGPQGTVYGRNATAGVVNLETAKPTDQFEAMASGELGNYHQRRFEGMINLPIVDDRVDLRIAGEWTKRQGYSFNEITGQRIDGRDLWSGRVSLAVNPFQGLKTTLVWEHFSEDDDRMRTSKQLCNTDQPPTSINGVPVPAGGLDRSNVLQMTADLLSQGCKPSSLYVPQAFQVPYGFSLPYANALGFAGFANIDLDPYASTTQSRNLRTIESTLDPKYKARNDVVELNADYMITPALTLTSQTGYNQDFLWSTEDYNRFNTAPGIFENNNGVPPQSNQFFPDPAAGTGGIPSDALVFCDPQVGCADRLVAQDLSDEHAWQLSQEFRLTSNFAGPLNFSIGGNYLHYETEENYYVFVNALTIYSLETGHHGSVGTDDGSNSYCMQTSNGGGNLYGGFQNPNPKEGGGQPSQACVYVDTNPITSLSNYGHNYFLSQNPYTLNSYAGFGEAYFQLTDTVKLTGGLRWTEDRKHFIDIPSELVDQGYGYPVIGIENQQWDQLTGRAVVNWTPKLSFTDQTLVYGSFSRGYKAGGANPPGAVLLQISAGDVAEPIHPLTFRPEFVNAFELGSKNTLFDGSLTLNGDVFYYDYRDYQISEIVDRTSINLNFNSKVKGAEVEGTWEPMPGLRFNFAGGYEDTRISNGQSAIDLVDRTDAANHPGWMVIKPFPSQASNCILPVYVVQAILEGAKDGGACGHAYTEDLDPGTVEPYVPNPTGLGGVNYPFHTAGGPDFPFVIPAGYVGFDPKTAPNDGEGFAKGLGGNDLPNAPPFTVSVGAQYSMPLSESWAGTLRGDYYWQDYSWARVFNDNPYDRIRGYTNVNLSLIFTNQNGWQVMLFDKNVFNTTAITGDFLNSDDSGLTTNVFLTDPRLVGVRVTKNW